MATNLGTMSAKAVMDASQFNAALVQMSSNSAKAAAGVAAGAGGAAAALGDLSMDAKTANATVVGSLKDITKANKQITRLVKGLGNIAAGGFLGAIAKASLGRLHEEAKEDMERIKSGGEIGPRSGFLREFESASKSLAIHFDDAVGVITIGLARIKESLVENFFSSLLPQHIAAVSDAEIAAGQRRAQRMAEIASFQSDIVEQIAGERPARLIGRDIAAQALSGTGLTADEQRTQAIERDRARNEYLLGLVKENVTLHMTAAEVQAFNLEMLGAKPKFIAMAEAVRQANAAVKDQQRLAERAADLTLRLTEEAQSPLDRFARRMSDIGEQWSLSQEEIAILTGRAVDELAGTLGSQNQIVPALEQGSRAAAEAILQTFQPERDVAAIIQAAQEQRRQQMERGLRLLEQINQNTEPVEDEWEFE